MGMSVGDFLSLMQGVDPGDVLVSQKISDDFKAIEVGYYLILTKPNIGDPEEHATGCWTLVACHCIELRNTGESIINMFSNKSDYRLIKCSRNKHATQ